MELAELDQIEPSDVRDPPGGLRLDGIQVKRSASCRFYK